MTDQKLTPPSVAWAQNHTEVFITINMECNDPEYKVTEDTFWFKGSNAADKVQHEVSFDLFGKVKSDSIKSKNIGRCVEYVLPKEDPEAEYWPRLTKASQKLPFLRVDFKKWVDEDEVPEKMNDMANDFGDMNFGNFMGGMGGGGEDGKLDFYDDALEDSDDDLEGPPPAEDVDEKDKADAPADK